MGFADADLRRGKGFPVFDAGREFPVFDTGRSKEYRESVLHA
ncbi:hypothetical protein QO011_006455 [Labrys wisconsinensis]|uniref:Uncharacterized protein n=1 Tax=Labrys wisconsinensis TaxID=425677 RepID=A0ABU0JGM1_9HYPH|nr:hypothetical protein [Labrys wisconsinensis]